MDTEANYKDIKTQNIKINAYHFPYNPSSTECHFNRPISDTPHDLYIVFTTGE